jgi:ParB/RepB/Spo0J family partition protein
MPTTDKSDTPKKTITIEMPDGAAVGGNGKSEAKPATKPETKPDAKADPKKPDEKKVEPKKLDESDVGTQFQVKVGDIIVDGGRNPRQDFNRERLASLSGSLKHIGIINPLSVYKTPDGKYHLIAGERRLRAAKLGGLATVPVKVFRNDETTILFVRADENRQAERLNPMEEAEVVKSLLGKSVRFPGERADTVINGKVLAQRWHVTEGYISQRLDLLNLPAPIQEALRQGKLKFTDARELLDISDPKKQLEKFHAFLKGEVDRKDIARTAEKSRHERRQAKSGKPLGRPAAADSSEAPNVVRQGLDKALERLRAVKKLEVKGNREVREGLELAYERYDRAQSEERRQYLKGVTATLEWMAGFRDEF